MEIDISAASASGARSEGYVGIIGGGGKIGTGAPHPSHIGMLGQVPDAPEAGRAGRFTSPPPCVADCGHGRPGNLRRVLRKPAPWLPSSPAGS